MTDEMGQDSGNDSGAGDVADGGAADSNDSGNGDWRSALPENLRDNATLANFKDVDSALQAFIDTKSLVGGSIRIPSQEAGPEDWKAFDQKLTEKVPGLTRIDPENPDAVENIQRTLGKPDEAVKYEMPEVEGLELPEDRVGFLRQTAHELGLTKKQFKEFVGKNLEADVKMMAEVQSQKEAGLKELRTEWGAAFESKVNAIRKMAEVTGAPTELINAVTEGKANAEALQWMDSLVSRFRQEPAAMGDQTGAATGALTPAEARERANEIMNRLSDMSPTDPQYQALVQKRFQYIEMANPSD